MKNSRNLKTGLAAIILVGILGAFILLDVYKCPFLIFGGIPCPTCGVTRAILALIQLDFKSYFEYNAMAFFLVIAVALAACRKHIVKGKRIIDGYIYIVLAINAIYYVIRLICQSENRLF